MCAKLLLVCIKCALSCGVESKGNEIQVSRDEMENNMSSVAVAMRHKSCFFSCQVADQEGCRLFGLAQCAFKTFYLPFKQQIFSLSLIAAYLV